MEKTRKEKIEEVLSESKSGMHVKDVAQEFIRRGLEKEISENDLMAKIVNALSMDMRKYKLKSRFRRIPNKKGGYKQGWYRLKKFRKQPSEIEIQEIEKSSDIEIPNISPLYTGKAGEYAVLSELLFREYNASVMSVDQGIDIVASKNDKFYHIQVKTANYRNGVFHTAINRTQFDRFNSINTFYIFVLRYSQKTKKIVSDFIVMMALDIEKFIEKGIFNKSNLLNFNIKIGNKKIILNGKEDISFFFNRFKYIN